jgi:hypothetical protein
MEALVESLNETATRGRASDVLGELIDKVVVSHDPTTRTRSVELIGELAALLSMAQDENAAALAAASNSLKLVAGARYLLDLLISVRGVAHQARPMPRDTAPGLDRPTLAARQMLAGHQWQIGAREP